MIRFNVLGTHAVGKSTLCFQLANALKMQNVNVKIIAENIRSCPFPINQAATIDTELWVFHKSVLEELHAKAEKYEAVILDRGVLDGIVYFRERNYPNEYYELLSNLALTWAENKYDVLILVEPDDCDKAYTVDAVRDSDIAYRKKIMLGFRSIIEEFEKRCNSRVIKVRSSDIFSDSTYAVDKILSLSSNMVKI